MKAVDILILNLGKVTEMFALQQSVILHFDFFALAPVIVIFHNFLMKQIKERNTDKCTKELFFIDYHQSMKSFYLTSLIEQF